MKNADDFKNATSVHEYWSDSSLIVRADKVPWTEWALPGTTFKLLDYDRNRSYTAILLKIEPTAPSTPHKHVGAANAYIISGGFSYEHGFVRAGDFFVEAGGTTHTPEIHSDGCTLLGFSFGSVVGFNEDGSVAGVIDVDWMIDKVIENKAFAHLENISRT